jgi:hypothetical protein
MRLVETVYAQPAVRSRGRKRAALVAICWVGGLASVYATLLLAIAAQPRYVLLGLVPTIVFFIAARPPRANMTCCTYP